MRLSLLLITLTISTTFLSGQQTRRAIVNAEDWTFHLGLWTSSLMETPFAEAEPFNAYSFVWEGKAENLYVRFSKDGISWEEENYIES